MILQKATAKVSPDSFCFPLQNLLKLSLVVKKVQ